MKTGSRIQFGFLGFKLIPILFVIGSGLIFFNLASISTLPIIWTGITGSLPFVLYAATGFEATAALSSQIVNAERNGPRAILISFSTMMVLVFLFQFLFYLILGNALSAQSSYLGAFPALLDYLLPNNPALAYKLQAFFNLAIASSALGGCYGILYSNNWNLYTLAQHKKIVGWQFLMRLNKHAIPYLCIAAEWLLCIGYLTLSGGNQLILQPLAALGTTLTYTISVIALWYAGKRTNFFTGWKLVAITALLSCLVLIGACIRNFILAGIVPLIAFGLLIICGLFFYRRNN